MTFDTHLLAAIARDEVEFLDGLFVICGEPIARDSVYDEGLRLIVFGGLADKSGSLVRLTSEGRRWIR